MKTQRIKVTATAPRDMPPSWQPDTVRFYVYIDGDVLRDKGGRVWSFRRPIEARLAAERMLRTKGAELHLRKLTAEDDIRALPGPVQVIESGALHRYASRQSATPRWFVVIGDVVTIDKGGRMMSYATREQAKVEADRINGLREHAAA